METYTLKNGVRVVVKRMEGLLSVTTGILVGTGSAFETDEEDGISHFIEHMQFKGTKTRTAFEISDAFDAIGAQTNAFTGKDMTCYYCKSTSDHAAEAFELLADLFLNSTFPEEEMAREKGVILEEIGMNEDTPEDLCLDLLARAAFGKKNYGRNILGPAQNVKNFTREDVFRYKSEHYLPQNIVISFAGNIGAEEAFRLAERVFGDMPSGTFQKRKKRVVFRTGDIFKRKKYEQVHLAFAFPSVKRGDGRVPAVQLMNTVLGGGLSSRLFKRVREELGLAYSVYSYTSHYLETGALTVYAGVNVEKVQKAVDAVFSVLKTLKEEGVGEEEFVRGREQLRAGLIYPQENTSSQMLLYGKQMLYHGEMYDFERKMKEVASLTREDVMKEIAALDLDAYASACVGKVRGEKRS